MKKDIGSHYDEEYFKWQRKYGIFGAVANQIKFRGYLDGKYKKVLDFGCGGGYLLAELKSKVQVIFNANPDIEVVIQSDASTPFDFVAKALASIQAIGVDSVGIITTGYES